MASTPVTAEGEQKILSPSFARRAEAGGYYDIYATLFKTGTGAVWSFGTGVANNQAAGVWGVASGWTPAQLALSTLGQDATLATPLIATEQNAGILLDSKVKAGTRGVELITDRAPVGSVSGAPGVMPTGWSGSTTFSGLARSIVSVGDSYVDFRLQGTATGTFFDFVSAFRSPNPSVLADEFYEANFSAVQVVAGALPAGGGVSYNTAFLNGAAFVSQVATPVPRHLARVPGSGVTNMRHAVVLTMSNGAAVDVTLRVSVPSVKKIPGYPITQTDTMSRPKVSAEVEGHVYAEYDGVNDSMETGVIDPAGATEVTLVTGITQLKDLGATAVLFEFGPNPDTNAGTFGVYGPGDGGTKRLGVKANGASVLSNFFPTLAHPAIGDKAVIAVSVNLTTGYMRIRVNGVTVAEQTVSLGGTFSAQKAYIGKRANNSLYGKFKQFKTVPIFGPVSDSQLAAIERDVAKATGVTL